MRIFVSLGQWNWWNLPAHWAPTMLCCPFHRRLEFGANRRWQWQWDIHIFHGKITLGMEINEHDMNCNESTEGCAVHLWVILKYSKGWNLKIALNTYDLKKRKDITSMKDSEIWICNGHVYFMCWFHPSNQLCIWKPGSKLMEFAPWFFI